MLKIGFENQILVILLTHDQVNASSITKIISWLKFLGKNLHLVGCATEYGKSEVMLMLLLTSMQIIIKASRHLQQSESELNLAKDKCIFSTVFA